MDHKEKRRCLIQWLLDEDPQYKGMPIPEDEGEQKRLLRGLVNYPPPIVFDA